MNIIHSIIINYNNKKEMGSVIPTISEDKTKDLYLLLLLILSV